MFTIVRTRTLRELRERLARSETALIGERSTGSYTRALLAEALRRADTVQADALRAMTEALRAAGSGPAPAGAAPVVVPAEEARAKLPTLPQEVLDACTAYAYGSVPEVVANRRRARQVYADAREGGVEEKAAITVAINAVRFGAAGRPSIDDEGEG